MNRRSKSRITTGLIVGGTLGTLLVYLLSPKRKQFNQDLKKNVGNYYDKAKVRGENAFEDTKSTVDKLKTKTEKLSSFLKKYAAGDYDGTIEKIESEIKTVRAALNKAYDTYQNQIKKREESEEALNDDSSIEDRLENEENFGEFEDDSLPKHVGMKKRN